MSFKFIFILPNIYECVNGVSTKYIKFINYLLNNNNEVILFTTFNNKEKMNEIIINNNKLNIIKVKGLNVPFYPEIKIPTLNNNSLDTVISNNDIIIFNGEFIWLYDILKKYKNKFPNIKLFPTIHTDYQYYAEHFYKKFNYVSTLNYLNHYLETKVFDGIVVTGKKMELKYSEYTKNIFNANELDLTIFQNHKEDIHYSDINNIKNIHFNIIFCGRISKEKNIEEVLICCNELYSNNYNFQLNIIGDGPFLENLKSIIDLCYKNIKKYIVFYGKLESYEINQLYHKLDNRIFIFTSMSETFGKTPMEAAATGVPIFIKKSDITDDLYLHKKNAFIFDDKKSFLEDFEYYIKLSNIERKIIILNSITNIKKYDQQIIFKNWFHFLTGYKNNDKHTKINFFDTLTLFGISKFINCSGYIAGD
jgi:1,2-diacylglycerol 3-alpha-glucosyltransferase